MTSWTHFLLFFRLSCSSFRLSSFLLSFFFFFFVVCLLGSDLKCRIKTCHAPTARGVCVNPKHYCIAPQDEASFLEELLAILVALANDEPRFTGLAAFLDSNPQCTSRERFLNTLRDSCTLLCYIVVLCESAVSRACGWRADARAGHLCEIATDKERTKYGPSDMGPQRTAVVTPVRVRAVPSRVIPARAAHTVASPTRSAPSAPAPRTKRPRQDEEEEEEEDHEDYEDQRQESEQPESQEESQEDHDQEQEQEQEEMETVDILPARQATLLPPAQPHRTYTISDEAEEPHPSLPTVMPAEEQLESMEDGQDLMPLEADHQDYSAGISFAFDLESESELLRQQCTLHPVDPFDMYLLAF